MSYRTRILSLAFVSALAVLLVPTALASTFAGDKQYVVEAGQTIDGNLYAFGQSVRVEGTVDGDLISAGEKVELAPGGVVKGDVMAAGQSVAIDGKVEGDVRAAGFMVQVGSTGSVGGELVGAGFSVGVADSASVGDDLTAAGAQGLVDGTVAGDLRFAGGGLDIQGRVDGDVDAEVDAPDEAAPDMSWMRFMGGGDLPELPRTAAMGLTVGPSAAIGGKLTYTGPEASAVSDRAARGGVTFEPKADSGAGAEEAARPRTAADRALGWLGDYFKWFISLALFGLALAWLAPRVLAAAGESLGERTLPSAGVGCLTVIAAVAGVLALCVATLLALLFVNAIKLGPLTTPLLSASFLTFALLTAGLTLLAWIGRIAVACSVGWLILSRAAPSYAGNRYATILVGLLIYVLATSLPNIGGLNIGALLDFIGILFGLGALVMQAWAWLRPGMAAALPSEPLAPAAA